MSAYASSLVAVPTEYAGILFRSKSEAVFARGLDLMRLDINLLWCYEPEDFRTLDGWVCDFLTVSQGSRTLHITCVEYKPCEPTAAYLGRIAGRFLEMKFPARLAVVYGSPFDTEVPRGALGLIDGTFRDLQFGDLFEYWDEARRYRFDLKRRG